MKLKTKGSDSCQILSTVPATRLPTTQPWQCAGVPNYAHQGFTVLISPKAARLSSVPKDQNVTLKVKVLYRHTGLEIRRSVVQPCSLFGFNFSLYKVRIRGKDGCLKTRKRNPTRYWICRFLVLDVTASRIVRNKFLLFKPFILLLFSAQSCPILLLSHGL